MSTIAFSIDDPLEMADRAGIEVTVDLPNGRRRWCVFVTPAALSSCGNIVAGARVHFGERHIITVSSLTADIIRAVLEELALSGDLESRTLPLEDDAVADVLDRLCRELGFCLPANDRARLADDPPRDADHFVREVFIAEGLDPDLADRDLVSQVRALCESYFRVIRLTEG